MTEVKYGTKVDFCSRNCSGKYVLPATIIKVFKNGNFKIDKCVVSWARIGNTNCAAPVTKKRGISQHLIVVIS